MGMGSIPLLPALAAAGALRGRNTLTLGAQDCVVVDVGCCCSVSVSVVVCVCVWHCVAIASVKTQVKRDSLVVRLCTLVILCFPQDWAVFAEWTWRVVIVALATDPTVRNIYSGWLRNGRENAPSKVANVGQCCPSCPITVRDNLTKVNGSKLKQHEQTALVTKLGPRVFRSQLYCCGGTRKGWGCCGRVDSNLWNTKHN